ncbi:MAG TPA: glucose-6-phosphate dehydrogenase assembly protein OpcA [Pyrinomonadaceae bacterium]|jgi:glucose-6-phosphate dehydrogenase assembly protein OpcA|nr:glucose-6-phosphate dehydrogenase assembly protein OpcA [Pyrinomonadaceae bacterium]
MSEMQTGAAGNTPQGIDVGRLEKELAANWQNAGDAAESSVTRVCVLNLIVYAAPGEDRAKMDELLDVVTEHAPGRTLVLIADRDSAEARLEAHVSTRCQIANKGAAKQVCGEQVTIEARGAAVDTAASAIEPLVVPDVPVFLWWKDIPHEEDKLFNRLVELSDRVVIDSLVFDRPHEDLKRLAQIIGARRQYMLASDLNWGRLTSWRNLIASFWDVPDYRPHLDALDEVLVEYDPPDVASGQIAAHALLLVGWLAAELKWQPAGDFVREGNNSRWVLLSGERKIKVEFRPTADRQGCDGLIATLTLKTSATGAEFYVGINEGWTKLETSAKIGDARTVGRVVSYEAKSEGERLSRELSLLSRDEVYERAVASVGQLLEVLQKS